MVAALSCSKPSSPRWFFYPGPLGRVFFVGLFIWTTLLSSGCSSVSVTDYAATQPSFSPEQFFSGKLSAHGVVKDYSGKVIRHFNADITACWKDGIGTLDEAFLFDDGEEQTRFWTLNPTGDQRYSATAGDVVGDGRAHWQGNAFFLEYVLRIPLDDDTIDVTIDDRMYRVSDTVLINESVMRKWGIQVGSILLTIVRHPGQSYSCERN